MVCKVTADEVNAFFEAAFAGGDGSGGVLEVAEDYALMRRRVGDVNMRPGGYISGPTQMAIADSAAYVAVFTRTGILPMAVTSSLTINFLRPCIGDAVMAEGRLMKIGKALAVIDVKIFAEGSDKVASHAVVNYALPRATETPG